MFLFDQGKLNLVKPDSCIYPTQNIWQESYFLYLYIASGCLVERAANSNSHKTESVSSKGKYYYRTHGTILKDYPSSFELYL